MDITSTGRSQTSIRNWQNKTCSEIFIEIFRTFVLAIITLTIFSCRSKEKKDDSIQILVDISQSYKVDVLNGVCTTFYMDKAPTQTEYPVPVEERQRLVDLYYKLGLDKMLYKDQELNKLIIRDECINSPSLYTFLHIKKNGKSRTIQIAGSCKYSPADSSKANKINSFLTQVFKPPYWKTIPESTVIYY